MPSSEIRTFSINQKTNKEASEAWDYWKAHGENISDKLSQLIKQARKQEIQAELAKQNGGLSQNDAFLVSDNNNDNNNDPFDFLPKMHEPLTKEHLRKLTLKDAIYLSQTLTDKMRMLNNNYINRAKDHREVFRLEQEARRVREEGKIYDKEIWRKQEEQQQQIVRTISDHTPPNIPTTPTPITPTTTNVVDESHNDRSRQLQPILEETELQQEEEQEQKEQKEQQRRRIVVVEKEQEYIRILSDRDRNILEMAEIFHIPASEIVKVLTSATREADIKEMAQRMANKAAAQY
jgi:hypothetical protein